jgi:hypothetical protein
MPKVVRRKQFDEDLEALKVNLRRSYMRACEVLVEIEGGRRPSAREHSEDRIPRVKKYELTDGFRIVFQQFRDSDDLIAVAVGKHDDVDRFLDHHRGFDFQAARDKNSRKLILRSHHSGSLPPMPSLTDAEPDAKRVAVFGQFDAAMLENLGVRATDHARLWRLAEGEDLEIQAALDSIKQYDVYASERLFAYATGTPIERSEILRSAGAPRPPSDDSDGPRLDTPVPRDSDSQSPLSTQREPAQSVPVLGDMSQVDDWAPTWPDPAPSPTEPIASSGPGRKSTPKRRGAKSARKRERPVAKSSTRSLDRANPTKRRAPTVKSKVRRTSVASRRPSLDRTKQPKPAPRGSRGPKSNSIGIGEAQRELKALRAKIWSDLGRGPSTDGLLRKKMIDFIIDHRISTKQAFVDVIPAKHRLNVHKKELPYLSNVFAIMRRVHD